MGTLPHQPDPAGNGARPVGPDGRPDTPPSGSSRRAPGGVSRLDRVTLQLGVAVAVVIAICSYAVSATSLYALGLGASYSWWQAAAVPVVADGPAIYGMFRIISRSRRNAKGAGYGWLLVGCGTPAPIGGEEGPSPPTPGCHAHPPPPHPGLCAAGARLAAASFTRRTQTERPHNGRDAAAGHLCPTAAGRP